MSENLHNCTHQNFDVEARIGRIKQREDQPDSEPVKQYMMDVRVWCRDCKKPFVFIGLEAGFHFSEPHVSIDGQEGRFPIGPEGEVVTELEGTPLGFTVRKTS